MDPAELVATIVTLAGSVVAGVAGVVRYIRGNDAKIATLGTRLKEVEVWTGLWRELIEKELPRLMHSPHTPEWDALDEKFIRYVEGDKTAMTLDDLARFRDLTQALIESDSQGRFGYVMLKAAINYRILEREGRLSNWTPAISKIYDPLTG